MAKISVIIPIYNTEKYLKDCLDSVVNQTLSDIEIICVNDCSTDNSLEILNKYAQNDNRINIIDLKENHGQGYARNLALDKATGDYIMFLDSDDWLDLRACEIVYNQISQNQNDFVMFNYKRYLQNKNIYKPGTDFVNIFGNKIQDTNIKINEFDSNFIKNCFSTCRIYNRKFLNINNIRYANIPFCEDNAFVINTIASGNNFSVIDKPLYIYRIHKNSTCQNTKNKKYIVQARMESYKILKEKNASEKLMRFFTVYSIITTFKWARKLSGNNKIMNKKLFYEVKNFFTLLAKEVNIRDLKDEINEKRISTYEDFCEIIENSYTGYLIKNIKKALKISNKLDIFKNIFFVKNENIHKIFCIFGFKFKIKSDKLIIKSLKQDVKNLKTYVNIKDNYEQVLNRLKDKIKNGEKINVIFYSNELQKWTYNSLYKEFEKSKYFEPIVVIIPLNRILDSEKDNELLKQYNFYKKLGCKVEYGYKNNEYLNLTNFNPDIIFYQQMWDVPLINKPAQTSLYAYTVYCPYGSQLLDYNKEYTNNFHRFLWLYICEHDLNIKRFESYQKGNSKNCKSFGYPKLDVYMEKHEITPSRYWKEPEKIKIIYAPHHSFGEKTLNMGTFLNNGEFIQKLAKNYSDITTWIFKPHPKLKFTLENDKFMTKEEIKKYWAEWDAIGKICEDGDYWDIFRTSDLMITDCVSFLTEYLPSGKPLIRLINPNSANFNKFGQHIISNYYNSYNNDELEKLFVDLAINKNDYKKEEREKLIAELIDFNESSAIKIIKYLSEKIGIYD